MFLTFVSKCEVKFQEGTSHMNDEEEVKIAKG